MKRLRSEVEADTCAEPCVQTELVAVSYWKGTQKSKGEERVQEEEEEEKKLNYDSKTTPSQQQHPEKDESETEGLVSLKACPLITVIIRFFHLSTNCDM